MTLLFEDDPESEFLPVATNRLRLRRDMRALGCTEEEIERMISFIPWPRSKQRETPNANRGKGKAYAFLAALVGHQGDECVTFPFCRNDEGYGMLGHDGRRHKAHRLMCQIAHGEPPTPEHTAAHLCGKGHEGCINPKHLEWKTQSDNLADREASAIYRGGRRAKLTPSQVQYIRDMRGKKPQRQLAAELGVTTSSINRISTERKWRAATPTPS